MGGGKMTASDWIILAINAGCAIVSILGAYNAAQSYKKCKQLTDFANLKTALDECKTINTNIRRLLTISNEALTAKKQGTNLVKEINSCSNNIKCSISNIKDILPFSLHNEVDKLLKTQVNGNELNVENYIDTLISGTALKNEKLVIDSRFEALQLSLNDIQKYIKQKMEGIQNSEKKM